MKKNVMNVGLSILLIALVCLILSMIGVIMDNNVLIEVTMMLSLVLTVIGLIVLGLSTE